MPNCENGVLWKENLWRLTRQLKRLTRLSKDPKAEDPRANYVFTGPELKPQKRAYPKLRA